MPLYSATAPCTAIYPGDTATVINAEALTTGQSSARVVIGNPYGREVESASVLLKFSADPGAFEVDVQQADVDADANYLNVSVGAAITSVDATNFTARADFAPFLGKFLRLKMKTQPANAVTLIAQVSR
jgi:hypothetical protein